MYNLISVNGGAREDLEIEIYAVWSDRVPAEKEKGTEISLVADVACVES